MAFSVTNLKTTVYPTIESCHSFGEKENPSADKYAILSIVEMSKEDMEVFLQKK